MFNSSLNKLLRQYLKKYELIEKIDIDNIEYSDLCEYISNNIHKANYLQDIDIPSELNSNSFWRTNLLTLLQNFNLYFNTFDNDINNKFLRYSQNMNNIKYSSKININIINQNFELISEGFSDILTEIFPDKVDYDEKYGKFSILFRNIVSELLPIWENLLYLWLAFILSKTENLEPAIIKYVYLNENELLNFKKSDMSEISLTIENIIDKISIYIDEYPNSHLCIIPVIRRNNYYMNYYSEELYPGIFYHAPNFDNQTFKCSRKFIYYPFKSGNNINNLNPFNPFIDKDFIRAGCIRDNSVDNFYLGSSVYGFREYNDNIYYAAPFDEIDNIREINPKTYYTAIRSVPSGNIYATDGVLIIENFKIEYYDVIQENLGQNALIGSYQTADGVITYLQLFAALKNTEKNYYIKEIIGLHHTTPQPINKELTKIRNYKNKDNFNFKYYLGECISAKNQSIEEDYSYLIEYIPFQYSWDNENLIYSNNFNDLSNYAGAPSDSESLAYKDNDLLHKHYIYDDEINNILDEKFVLRIGQHLEIENFDNNTKNLIPNKFKVDNKISYFDYADGTTDIEEKTTSSNIERYNTGTIEIGAYLNIPFIKNRKKRVQYYPDFLSHTYRTDNLIPLTLIEKINIDQQVNPEYFSYNKVFKNSPIEKKTYFQIYTETGAECFDNHNWGIKMIEVINQETPTEKTFFKNEIIPPYKVATMEELYEYYIQNNNNIRSKKILPFFSQLNPSSKIEKITPESIFSNINTSQFKTSINNILNLERYLPTQISSSAYKQEIMGYLLDNISKYFLMNQQRQDNMVQLFLLNNRMESISWTGQYRTDSDYMNVNGYPQFIDNPINYSGQQCNCLTWYSTLEDFEILYNNIITKLPSNIFINDFPRQILKHYSNDHEVIENSGGIITGIWYSNIKNQMFLWGDTSAISHKDYKSDDNPSTELPNYEYWTPEDNGISNTIGIDEIYAANDSLQNLKNYFLIPIRIAMGGDYSYWHKCIGSDNSTSFNYERTYHLAYNLICSSSIPSFVFHEILGEVNTDVQRHHPNTINIENKYNRYALFKGVMGAGNSININVYYSKSKLKQSAVFYHQLNGLKGYISHRQIPHLFLASCKTLFPKKEYLINKNNNEMQYKIYCNNNKAQLSNFYNKMQELTETLKKELPYPFPTKRLTATASYNIFQNNIINETKNMKNPLLPIKLNLSDYQLDTRIWREKKDGDIAINDDIDNWMNPGQRKICWYANDNNVYSDTSIENVTIQGVNESTYTPTYQFLNDTDINATTTLDYEDNNSQNIGALNLQIIVHWFGADGKYARKVLTRQLTGTPSQEDYFVVDGEHELNYQEWTNTWTTEYFNQSIFTNFEADKTNNNLKLFKESASLTTSAGHLDFETYKNNGINF